MPTRNRINKHQTCSTAWLLLGVFFAKIIHFYDPITHSNSFSVISGSIQCYQGHQTYGKSPKNDPKFLVLSIQTFKITFT